MAELQINEEQQTAIDLLHHNLTEETLWECVIAYQNYPFRTVSGLPFRYELKRGRNGKLNRELMIDRREGSKSLTWSSFRIALSTLKDIFEEEMLRKQDQS